MKILGIASVTNDSGVALIADEEVLGHIPLPDGRGLSESLLPSVRTLLSDTGTDATSLDGIAVTAGPGSFTGIKVGLAAAKGLAYALPCPVIGISTLEALAFAWSAGSRDDSGIIVPLINAGRDQIFAGCYHISGGTPDQKSPDSLTSLPGIHALIPKPSILAGDAARLVYDSAVEKEGLTLANSRHFPLAVAIARLGLARIRTGIRATPIMLSPLYLQRPEAEILLEKRLISTVGRSSLA